MLSATARFAATSRFAVTQDCGRHCFARTRRSWCAALSTRGIWQPQPISNICTHSATATIAYKQALQLSPSGSGCLVSRRHTISTSNINSNITTAHINLTCRLQHLLPALVMARQADHSMHSTAACRAYVGEATPAAGEYHCNDFDWEDLRQEAEAMLAARYAQHQVLPSPLCSALYIACCSPIDHNTAPGFPAYVLQSSAHVFALLEHCSNSHSC